MTKHTLRLFSLLFVFAAAMSLIGCATDSTEDSIKASKPVDVDLTISMQGAATRSAAPSVSGRAATVSRTSWDDPNAVPGEMMRHCFVVAVQNGKIAGVLVSDDYPEEKSYAERLTLRINPGETTIYSFANIRPSQLGIDAAKAVGTAAPDFDRMTYGVAGNVNAASDFTDGIPMSGKLQTTITERTSHIDLEVIRMVAKMRLTLTNESAADFRVRSITLSDITADASDNLMLMPDIIDDERTAPNLSSAATAADRTIKIGGDDGTTLLAGGKNSIETVFYLNESVARSTGCFILNVETDQQTVSHRVAMTDWNTIARNDYLRIPIRLNDYRISFDAEQFTAIGVLPTVRYDKDMLTATFASYGEFHLRPTVTRLSDGKVLTAGNEWSLTEWKVLSLKPDGEAGTCIYDRMPYLQPSSQTIEGFMGNRAGTALHQVFFQVAGLSYAIPYKVQIIRQ